MKLRLKGSSVRLRLTQGEVARLGAGGEIAELVALSTEWSYRLVAGGKGVEVLADDRGITVTVPEALLSSWVGSDEVGIYSDVATATGTVKVSIEKDFSCLVARDGEDDSDAFPHPEAPIE